MNLRAIAVAPLAFALVTATAARGDEASDFKREWAAASGIGDANARAEKQLKALEKLRGATSVAAAQAALAVAIDAGVHWKVHALAFEFLMGTSAAAPVRAWATKEVSA